MIFGHVLDQNICILIQRRTIGSEITCESNLEGCSPTLTTSKPHDLLCFSPACWRMARSSVGHLAEVCFFIFLLPIYDILPLVCIWDETHISLETDSSSSSIRVLLEGAVLMQGSNRENLSLGS